MAHVWAYKTPIFFNAYVLNFTLVYIANIATLIYAHQTVYAVQASNAQQLLILKAIVLVIAAVK